ncbi:sensor histidine kinase [Ohessyouella blattaphilus]|uniref:Histidine kinase n=1 Tax=Ohessyouella blattaphilus TaxID=2949333 RepID=A0ABT1EL57_9FIRM|nr:histidine kinase [Ohessyouella blattaphilus]MCP1110517.1 histidine kinase [Ohessyouella blattaphilus]MCR8563911.1 histidine kinase [Ohessyouella blattaphilus]
MVRGRIATKLTKQILGITGIIYASILVVIFFFAYQSNRDIVIRENEIYAENLVTQIDGISRVIISSSNMIFTDDILRTSFEIYENATKEEQDSLYEKVSFRLGNLSHVDNRIKKVVLVAKKDNELFYGSQGINLEGVIDWEDFERFRGTGTTKGFGKPYVHRATDGLDYIYCNYYGNNHFSDGRSFDIVMVFNISGVLKEEMTLPIFTEYCMILNGQGDVLHEVTAANDSANIGENEVEKGVFVNKNSEVTAWRVLCGISQEKLVRIVLENILNVLVASGLLIILVLVITPRLINRMLKPLSDLSESMKTMETGNLHELPSPESNDELETLVNQFNFLIKRIKQHILSEKQMFEENKQLEYDLILAQIDPHFIYNTLLSVNYLALKNRSKDVVEVNNALIMILQDRLKLKEYAGFVTVEQELLMIEQYFIIQNKRYGNGVVLEYDVEIGTEKEKIPKFILQPIVENAFNHGFVSEGYSNGQISIKVSRRNRGLLMVVADTGKRISEDKLYELNQGKFSFEKGRNFGLYSVNERLQHYYKKDFSISFSSNDKLTEVSIHIG